jgi:transcriptional regulator with XRE-family HTH domain
MENNCKQKNLDGFDRFASSSGLDDVVQDLTTRCGLATIAEELGIDKAQLSRFRSGDGALNLEAIEKLLKSADVVVIPRQKYIRMIQAFITMNDFLKEAIGC